MAEVNLPAFMAGRLRSAGKKLYSAGEKMPEDRFGWHPETDGNKGRDALDQVLECAYLNEWAANAFRTGTPASMDNDDYGTQTNARRNKDAALKWLKEGTEALASAVEGMSPEQLGSTITHPFYNTEVTWADYADFFYWNTIYHEGQVNYIQVLYGDTT
jgi:hypothetical protein